MITHTMIMPNDDDNDDDDNNFQTPITSIMPPAWIPRSPNKYMGVSLSL